MIQRDDTASLNRNGSSILGYILGVCLSLGALLSISFIPPLHISRSTGMPTAAEFENALNEVPEAWFIFSLYVPRILVQLHNWYLRINVNSSDPRCLHFTYYPHENVSIYIHLQQGELDSVMGIKLKRLLAIVVQRAKADHPNRPAVVDLRREDSVWATIDD